MAAIQEQRNIVGRFRDQFRSRPNLPVHQTQKAFPSKAPVKGAVWIAQGQIKAANEHGVVDAVFKAIDFSKKEDIVLPPQSEADARDVPVEWVGRRRGADKDTRQSEELSPHEVFRNLQVDIEHDATIIFSHGGAFYTGTAVTARPTTTKLARQTKARVVAVDYRLSPQSQFPAALIDLFLVYLALLYPPPGSMHTAVPAQKIILTGESAGGGLSMALIQLIIQLRRMQKTDQPQVVFGGQEVVVPMPGGAALLCPELDRSLSMPSHLANGDIDFIQDIQPANHPSQPPDDIWPSNPPRHDVYCHASGFAHPMCGLITATDWRGSPPIWMAYGEERCLDSGKVVASTAFKQGVPVQFSQYLGMPHIFAIVLARFKQSQMCMADWARVCCEMADGADMQSCGKIVRSVKEPADSVEELDLSELWTMPCDEKMRRVHQGQAARQIYTGKSTRASL